MQTGTIDALKKLPDLSQFGEIGKVVMVLAKRIRELESRGQVVALPSKKEYYSIQETAEILGYHYNTVYNLITKRKLLKANRACRNYKIHFSDLEKLRNECTI